jgi:hypothetical protein
VQRIKQCGYQRTALLRVDVYRSAKSSSGSLKTMAMWPHGDILMDPRWLNFQTQKFRWGFRFKLWDVNAGEKKVLLSSSLVRLDTKRVSVVKSVRGFRRPFETGHNVFLFPVDETEK